MILAKKYRIIKSYYCIQSYDESVCPNCNSKLKVRGSKKRWIIETDGTKTCYNLRQLQCMNCKKIHIEYIDKIVPYKHYSAEAISEALISSKSSCVAENSTIREWKKDGNVLKKQIIAGNGVRMDIPLLSIVPQNTLAMDSVEIEFDAKIESASSSQLSNTQLKSEIVNAQVQLGLVGKKEDGVVHVKVVFKSTQTPEGLNKLIDECNKYV